VQETLEYFANPDNLNSDVLPPGLSTWDPAPYLASAVPIAVSVVGVNFMHELGHRIAAFIRKVKLGPTYFIPNLQVRPGVLVPCPPGLHMLRLSRQLLRTWTNMQQARTSHVGLLLSCAIRCHCREHNTAVPGKEGRPDMLSRAGLALQSCL
jgi:hypothetical protein